MMIGGELMTDMVSKVIALRTKSFVDHSTLEG
jgi:hypothetical protein